MPTNLFVNPQWSSVANGIPADWRFTYVNQEQADSPVPGETMPLPGQSQPFHQPRIIAVAGVVEIALESSPMWAALSQILAVQVGATYKLSCKVLPDLKHNGVTANPESSELRFISQGATAWIHPAVGVQTPVNTTFVATQASLAIGIEVRTIHGLSSIKWQLTEPSLELVSAPSGDSGNPPPTDTTAPNPIRAIYNDTITLRRMLSAMRDRLDAAMLEADAIASELWQESGGE